MKKMKIAGILTIAFLLWLSVSCVSATAVSPVLVQVTAKLWLKLPTGTHQIGMWTVAGQLANGVVVVTLKRCLNELLLVRTMLGNINTLQTPFYETVATLSTAQIYLTITTTPPATMNIVLIDP